MPRRQECLSDGLVSCFLLLLLVFYFTDPNRKTKSAYISKKFKGSLSVSEGARHPLSREVASSLKQCTNHCLQHTSCISFVFSELREECSLYSQYQSELFSPSDEEDSYWVYDLSE